MAIGEHFKKHGAVHALWLFSVLVAIIAVLALLVPNGTLIRDYISFASAVSSIILAVIAIFYSMFSNQSFSEMVGSLKSSIQRVEGSSVTLEETSSNLLSLAERISIEVSSLAPRFDAINSKIEERFPPDRISPSPPPSPGDSNLLNTVMTSGIRASLYIIIKMHETGKRVSLDEIYDTDIWRRYVGGCLSTLSYLNAYGIKIKVHDAYNYELVSINDDEVIRINSLMKSKDRSKKYLASVDKYFDILNESHENGEDSE
jgi:hypothetical protein